MTDPIYGRLPADDAERRRVRERDPSGYRLLVLEAALRPLAAQAHPGPWHRSHGCVTCSGASPLEERFLFSVEMERGMNGTDADARWVCAANPLRIVELLDLALAIKEERDALLAPRAEVENEPRGD